MSLTGIISLEYFAFGIFPTLPCVLWLHVEEALCETGTVGNSGRTEKTVSLESAITSQGKTVLSFEILALRTSWHDQDFKLLLSYRVSLKLLVSKQNEQEPSLTPPGLWGCICPLG